jgi:glycosyltransferase involved in cell wall biosynthesis
VDSLPIYLYAGKLVAHKGVNDLVEAFTHFKGGNLIIAGDGVDRKILESQSNGCSNIYFTGFLNQTEIVDYYQATDFIVLASRFEPWGLCINEGLAAGAIPITSDACGCVPELVETTSNLIFRSQDLDSLIKVLEASQICIGQSKLKRQISKVSKVHDVGMSAVAIQKAIVNRTKGQSMNIDILRMS